MSGAIHGPRWAEGRWPGKHALRFARRDDQVRLELPGKYRALTLAAWVNLAGLDNEFNGLLLSDGWGRPGQFHWQLTRSGRMDFGICSGPSDSVYRSPPLPESDDFGHWLHLAVVYDADAKQIAFYADGRQVNVKPLAADIGLLFGPCQIGNWESAKGEGFPIRNLQGRMDELVIFRRALSASEVKTMYEEGRP